MKARDLKIDIAKGIAIFSVVLAHIDTGLKSQIIYLFHMPFFFIASGYFHRVDRDEIGYLQKKCTSLLVPYFVYLLIFNIPRIFEFSFEALIEPSVETLKILLGYIARLLHGGYLLKGSVGVFWFVTCLFLTQQLFNFISVRIQDKRRLFAIAIALYIVSTIDQLSPGHLVLPWAANVVFGAFFFYALGSIYGNYIFKARSQLLIFLAVSVSVFSIVLVSLGLSLSFSMKQAYYGFFILSPLAAFSLTKLLVLVSSALSKVKGLAPMLSFMGQASITIMFVHRSVQYALPDFLHRDNILSACIITAICCVIHQGFKQVSVLRALFLGSRKDVDGLAKSFKED
jgi:polysaccharide biosynthesis protein PslL